jgi:hypothetical protein
LGRIASETRDEASRSSRPWRQEHRHDALEQLRVAPEDVEGLVVDLELLASVEEHAGECPVEIIAPLDPGDFERTHRVDHPVRPDRQARGAQHPREMHDVLGEVAVPGGRDDLHCTSVSMVMSTRPLPTAIGALAP